VFDISLPSDRVEKLQNMKLKEIDDENIDDTGIDSDIANEQETPCKNIEENMESMYNIALMLPFYLEEVDSLESKEAKDISDLRKLISFRFIQFY